MLVKELHDAIQAQVQIEEESARIYEQMSLVCNYLSWEGFAKWYWNQAVEEHTHAKKFIDYLNIHGHMVILEEISKPSDVDLSDLDAKATLSILAKQGYEHEQYVTSTLQKIAEGSLAAFDFTTMDLLQWFMDEQVEEEDKFARLMAKLSIAGQDAAMLYELDEHYGEEAEAEATAPLCGVSGRVR